MDEKLTGFNNTFDNKLFKTIWLKSDSLSIDMLWHGRSDLCTKQWKLRLFFTDLSRFGRSQENPRACDHMNTAMQMAVVRSWSVVKDLILLTLSLDVSRVICQRAKYSLPWKENSMSFFLPLHSASFQALHNRILY
jgi:hypothetical protein